MTITDTHQTDDLDGLPEAADDWRYDEPAESTPRASEPARARRLLRWFLRLLAVFVTAIALLFAFAAAHNLYTPSSSAFMDNNPHAIQEWVDLGHISRYPIAAAIVLEDAELGTRTGAFDLEKFTDTAEAYLGGDSDVAGGSTIPQQLVKNLYLSGDRTAWRKGVEAVLSTSFALTVSDSRMLELYFNYAQFGTNIYGVCAASWYYFGSPPWSMTLHQGAQLAAILPLPTLARRADGGGIYVVGPESDKLFRWKVYRRVPGDIEYLGGVDAVMETVGITDKASDHEHTGADSCSEMPPAIRQLLIAEGAR